ncbi:MAG: L-threonylcarbamoyladenylate synthase [bacterium]
MLLRIYPENPNQREVRKAAEIVKNGGVIIYPTDTIYGVGCDIFQQKAAEKVALIKGIDIQKADFSFICYDLSHVSFFTSQIDNTTFKLLKRNLPGPFTFILNANNNVPKYFRAKKRTVGIRIPNNDIIREIVKVLGHPILTTSINDDDDNVVEYMTDPELIHEKYKKLVDLVIDGGFGKNIPSTIVDCTGDEPVIRRQGIGELKY